MNDNERDVLLARVDERVKNIHNTLERGAIRMDKNDTRMNGHGKRLSRLERWRSAVVAVVAVVLFLIGAVLRAMS